MLLELFAKNTNTKNLNLDAWVHLDGNAAQWSVQDDYFEVVPGTGNLITRQSFGDFKLYLEFWLPHLPNAYGQERANSGVFLQGRYEIQILDSFNNPTYPGGECGALYKRHQPIAMALRPPEQWQSYEVHFQAPRPHSPTASICVWHNGVLIHDHALLDSPTGGQLDDRVLEPGPVMLQDHGCSVRFRNVRVEI